jgi:hypothetical protein
MTKVQGRARCPETAATRRRRPRLYVLEKAGPGRLIAGCVAAVLACEAQAQFAPPVTQEIMVAWE